MLFPFYLVQLFIEDGNISSALPPDPDTILDITDAVAGSVEVASSLKSEED